MYDGCWSSQLSACACKAPKGAAGSKDGVILDDAKIHDADDASQHVSLIARDDVYRRTPQKSTLCKYDQAIPSFLNHHVV